MFQTLPASVIESLAVVLTEKVFPPKAVVFYQGNEVEDLFFIQRGHIKVTSHRWLGTARTCTGLSIRSLAMRSESGQCQQAVRAHCVLAGEVLAWNI